MIGWLFEAVSEWGRTHLRDFAWRHTSDPFKVFLVETLLKRTTSVAVARTYGNLVEKYSSFSEILAHSHELENDLRPIGLYRQRAKTLLRAANFVSKEFGGVLPTGQKQLEMIPGVGQYTSAAICSFAYNLSIPVVDSNVLRIIKRFTGGGSSTFGEVKKYMTLQVNGAPSKPINYAMLDLGALVCRPVKPTCNLCPLEQRCEYAGGMGHKRKKVLSNRK